MYVVKTYCPAENCCAFSMNQACFASRALAEVFIKENICPGTRADVDEVDWNPGRQSTFGE